MARELPKVFNGMSDSPSIRLALWRQDEASGTAVADEMGTYPLTCSASANIVEGLFGSGGKARDYTASISTGTADTTLRDTAKDEWTVQALVKLTGTPSDSFIFSIDNSGGGAANRKLCSIYVQSTGEVVCEWENAGGTVQTTSATTLVEDVVYMVCVRKISARSGVANKFDVDFIFISADSFVVEYGAGTDLDNAESGTSSNVSIGDSLASSSPFPGIIDEVAFSAGAIDDNQIRMDAIQVFYPFNYADMIGSTDGMAVFVQVWIEDGDGRMQNACTLSDASIDYTDKISISSDVDAPHTSATIELFRNVGMNSLAFHVEGSLLNQNEAGAYSPLVELKRKIHVLAAYAPQGYIPVGYEFVSVFEGLIQSVDPSGRVKIDAADKSIALFDVFIVDEATYENRPPVSMGAQIQTLIDDNRPTGGYRGWPTDEPVLRVVDDPGFTLNGYIQQQEPVREAARNLALQIGFDTRLKYDDTSGKWRFSLYSPDRTATAANWTITAAEQRAISTYVADSTQIRNSITVTGAAYDNEDFTITSIDDSGAGSTVEITTSSAHGLSVGDRIAVNQTANFNGIYTVASTPTTTALRTEEAVSGSPASESNGRIALLDPTGAPRRISVTVEDTASIAQYGYMPAIIEEGETSNLDTIDEITDFANAILSDLAQPKADVSLEIAFNPFIEEGDLVELLPDYLVSDQTRTFAVVGIQHDLSAEQKSTTLQLRGGKPIGGYELWLQRIQFPGLNIPRSKDIVQAPVNPIVEHVQGGMFITIDAAPTLADRFFNNTNNRDLRREIHVSDVADFTPSAITFAGLVKDTVIRIDGYTPEQEVFVALVERDVFGSRGPKSDEVAVIPRYGITVPNFKAARASTDQSIPTATATKLQFNSEIWDETGDYDPTTNHRFTAKSTGVGYHVSSLVSAKFDMDGKPNEYIVAEIRQYSSGGTLLDSVVNEFHDSLGSKFVHVHLSGDFRLSAGDYLEAWVTASTLCDLMVGTTNTFSGHYTGECA